MTTRVNTDGIADDAVTAAKIATGAVGTTELADGGVTAAKIATGAVPMIIGVRQTVQGGPIDGSGLPNFLPTSSGTLTLTTQNVSAIYPLVVSASQGFGANCERTGSVTSNSLSWTLNANTGVNYLYVDVVSDGTLSTGQTTTPPVYSYSGSAATANGTNTFNIKLMKMYAGNGTTAPAVWRVFVGEATAGATAISGVIAYAYNGFYVSVPAVMAMSSVTNFSCNIGAPFNGKGKLICQTAEYGFYVGDEIDLIFHAGYGGTVQARNDSTVGYWKRCDLATYSGMLSAAYFGSPANWYYLTNAKWNVQVICERKF